MARTPTTADTTTTLSAEPEEVEADGATTIQLEALAADTPEDEIHQRQHDKADYVTARFVQDRLDAAVGPDRWQSMFQDIPGGVRCGISILVQRNDSAEWITKWDVGVPSTFEAVKGAHSDAFKRAAVHWGIARDLYDERDDRVGPFDNSAAAPQPGAVVAPDAPPRIPIAEQAGAVAPVSAAPVAVAGAAPWVCPVHNEVKIVPGGVSRRSGRAYTAFFACPVPGCDHKGPSVAS